MTIENVALTFLWHLMAFNGPCSIPMSIANVSSWKSYWGLHFCCRSLTQIWPWLIFLFRKSTVQYYSHWNLNKQSKYTVCYRVVVALAGSLIERSLFWHYRINNFGSSMADDDDQRAPFLPMQGRWNLEMSGEHVHPYIGHNSSKDSKKYSIYTLRSVNDVTEGSTQEAHMCAY